MVSVIKRALKRKPIALSQIILANREGHAVNEQSELFLTKRNIPTEWEQQFWDIMKSKMLGKIYFYLFLYTIQRL
jgi:hypothetical protein